VTDPAVIGGRAHGARGALSSVAGRLGARPVASAVVWAGTLVFAIGFTALAALRHEAFLSHRYDLGNMTQAVWSTAHGHPLEITDTAGDQVSRLGSHVDPILVLFAPLWWLWPSPVLLTTVQALALASGALPVYWLARKHIGDDRGAWALAIAYLLYPAVQWNALNDFHPVTLAIPLLLFMVWFLDEDRLVPALVVGVLAASTKEDVPLVIAGIGIWYALRRGRPVVGAAIAAASLAWTAIAVGVVVPHFHGGPSPFYGRYDSVGGSPRGIVETLFTHPGRIWDAATTGSDLRYLFLLLVPLLLLWALEPILALAALPALALNLLSDFWSMNRIDYQYVSAIVACLFAAAAIGAGKLGQRWGVVAAVSVLAVVAVASLSGPLGAISTYGENGRPADIRNEPLRGVRLAAVRDALSLIPRAAAVTASNRIGAHLSERRRIFAFPVRSEADWLIVDTRDPWLAGAGEGSNPWLYATELARVRADPAWRPVFERQGILVLRRVDSRGSRAGEQKGTPSE
jgi:uncharacterized membrane protein